MSFRHDREGTAASRWRAHPRWSRLAALTPLHQVDRLVVLAAHPDDESLGAGGLIATAHADGLEVRVVVATLGERSHPRSRTHTPDDLASLRRDEVHRAVSVLAPGSAPTLLSLPDGDLARHEETLVEHLVALVGDGRRTLLVAPWRHDGHPDHDAAGRAAATAAARTGARLLEHPIWWWHWATPDEVDWSGLGTITLTDAALAAKHRAIVAHRSQVAALSGQPGDEVLLGADVLAHFADGVEVFVTEPPRDAALDDLHATWSDPWGVDSRWYERRKRDLLLATLPRPRFERALEIGCSTGALTAALAARCDAVVGVDASPHAVAAAHERLGDLAHVEVLTGSVPTDWPSGPFDLVVVSEVGYFLSPADLDEVVERVRAALLPDGVVVLCHWRHPVHGWVLDGADVHTRFREAGLRPVLATYADRDVELLVLADEQLAPDPSR